MKTFTLFRNAQREWHLHLPDPGAGGMPETWYRVDVVVDDFPQLREIAGEGLRITWGGSQTTLPDRMTLEQAILAGRAREINTSVERQDRAPTGGPA